MTILEKWRLSKDKDNSSGTLLTDLSHELLIVKLTAYNFNRSALKLMYTYLFDRKQRTKINIFYSSLQDILTGVPQGSILG